MNTTDQTNHKALQALKKLSIVKAQHDRHNALQEFTLANMFAEYDRVDPDYTMDIVKDNSETDAELFTGWLEGIKF